ncbi:MAG TPA: tryptophan-rich sensory protein [Candidatus Merdenecus merdavium]|nr:tryptophan-rich sensory protein [Candidatus Merdenecus merdavium]
MKFKKNEELIISILIPLTVGAVSSLLSGSMMKTYEQLVKPRGAPPATIFPILWTILYVFMGISFYILWTTPLVKPKKAIRIYFLQLFFNFFWSILFFHFHAYLLSFIWILLMIFIIIFMINEFYKINPLAAVLQIPYLVWSVFAAYLNFMVFLLN